MLLKERQRRIEERVAKGGAAESDGEDDEVKSESEGDDSEEEDEEFFTEGTDDLLQSRRDVAWYSLARAKRRIERQKKEAQVPLSKLVAFRRQVFDPLKVSVIVSVFALLEFL